MRRTGHGLYVPKVIMPKYSTISVGYKSRRVTVRLLCGVYLNVAGSPMCTLLNKATYFPMRGHLIFLCETT